MSTFRGNPHFLRQHEKIQATQPIILAVEFQGHAIAGQAGKDAGRNRVVERCKPHRCKCLRSGFGRLEEGEIFRCMSPSPISQARTARRNRIPRSEVGSVDGGRRPPATRSIVLSYLAEAGRSRIEQKSSSARRRRSSTPRRISKRSTSNAGGLEDVGERTVHGRYQGAVGKETHRCLDLEVRQARCLGLREELTEFLLESLLDVSALRTLAFPMPLILPRQRPNGICRSLRRAVFLDQTCGHPIAQLRRDPLPCSLLSRKASRNR